MQTENIHGEMTPVIKTLVLAGFPEGSQVVQATSYRPDYLPFPMRILVKIPSGETESCVVKFNRPDKMEREVLALRLLDQLGLPAPRLLSEPADANLEGRKMLVMSEISGRALPWCDLKSLNEAHLACCIMIEGVGRLHALTVQMSALDTGKIFPRMTLIGELNQIKVEAGEWMQVSLFQRALETLSEVIPQISTPLAFTNGDYNPINFLYDGKELCGFVDFEEACFEDPHIGFAKFLIWSYDDYGWGTGVKAGLVERYLYTRNLSQREFAPRLVLRCLRHLILEAKVGESANEIGRSHILNLVKQGLETL